MISSWTFFWLVGGEVSGSQHHQPSVPNRSGVYMLVGSINFSHLVRVSVSAKQLKDIVMYIPWGGTRSPPQGCTIFSFDWSSFPWLASVWTCSWNSGKVREAEWSLFPVTKKWGWGGVSLLAQWLRIRLPMQGTRDRALVWEDPTCRGANGPVSHNYWACASGTCAPRQERRRQWEARALQWRVAPASRN